MSHKDAEAARVAMVRFPLLFLLSMHCTRFFCISSTGIYFLLAPQSIVGPFLYAILLRTTTVMTGARSRCCLRRKNESNRATCARATATARAAVATAATGVATTAAAATTVEVVAAAAATAVTGVAAATIGIATTTAVAAGTGRARTTAGTTAAATAHALRTAATTAHARLTAEIAAIVRRAAPALVGAKNPRLLMCDFALWPLF